LKNEYDDLFDSGFHGHMGSFGRISFPVGFKGKKAARGDSAA
jgi:hypothetical protein